MITRLPLRVLKHSIRSVHFTLANTARGRGSNISKEEIESRRENRKSPKEETETISKPESLHSSASSKWDLTPQSMWISNSLPETALLKFKTNPKLDAENVAKQSKMHYTARTCTTCGVTGLVVSGINFMIPGVEAVTFMMLPLVIAQNIFQPRAIDSRMQICSGVYFDPTTGVTSALLTNTDLILPNKIKEIDDIPLIVLNIPPVLDDHGHQAIIKNGQEVERISHIFDKKETTFDKISMGLVGKMTKSVVTKFANGMDTMKVNPAGKNPFRGSALIAFDDEFKIQPVSDKTTNGITVMVRVDLEKAIDNEDWSSTDLIQFMKKNAEKEKPFNRQS